MDRKSVPSRRGRPDPRAGAEQSFAAVRPVPEPSILTDTEAMSLVQLDVSKKK